MTNQSWKEYAPGWDGGGAKPIEFLMADGSIRPGTFDVEDSCFDGESSYPIWFVRFPDGTRLSFYDDSIKGWRHASPVEPENPARRWDQLQG